MKAWQVVASASVFTLYVSALAQGQTGSSPPTDPPPSKPATAEPSLKTPPPHPSTEQAVAVLKKADMACSALKAVRYVLKTERPGATGRQRNHLEGEAILKGWKDGYPERFRYDVRTFPSGSNEPNEVIVGFDGESYYAIDKKMKKVHVGRTPAALGIYGIVLRFFPVHEFVRPHPFEDEIASNQIEYRGPSKVGDEDCETVFVAYGSGGEEALWSFSKKDYLPRQVDRKFRSPDGATTDQQWVLSLVRPDPKADDEVFKLRVPDGFTRIDGSAP